jgi:hypothetical protein
MAFTDEITALVGSSTANAQIDLAMEAGCADVVRKVALTNPEELWLFTTTTAIPSTGLEIGSGKIYDVEVAKTSATVLDPSLRFRAQEEDSINYATGEFPVYYLLEGKIHVLPPVSTVDVAGTPWTPSVFATADGGDSTLITLDDGPSGGGAHTFNVGDYAIIEQASAGADTYYVGTYKIIETSADPNTIKIEKNYIATAVTGYIITKAYAKATYLGPHNVDPTTAAITNFPESYYRFPVLYAACSVLMTRMNDTHSSLPILSVDEAPIVPVINEQLESLPTYVPPSGFVPPTPPSDVDVDYTGVGSPPTMDSVDAAVFPVLSFDISDINITSLSISDAPIPPLGEDGSDGTIDFTTVVTKVPVYNKPVFSAPSFPAIPDLVLPESPVPPSLNSPSDINFSFASTAGNHPELTLPVIGALDYSGVTTYIENEEDPELAGSKLQQIQAQLGEFQARVSSEQVEFNKNMEIYKAQIAEEMEEQKLKLNKENQSEQQKLAMFGAEVQKYQAEVNTKMTEWTKNNLDVTYTKWIQEFEKGLSQYQQDMANEMNKFNEAVAEYQSEIAKVTAEATNKLTVDQNRFARKYQAYQGDVEKWKTTVNKELTEWTTQVAQPIMTKFAQIRGENLSSWQTDCSNELQSWANRIQYAQQKHAADLQQWQALFTKATTTYTSETGYDMAKYQAEVQTAVQRYQSDTDMQGNDFKAKLEKYTAEMNSVNAKNNAESATYQSALGAYQAKLQADLGKYNADVQKNGLEYKWLMDKYVLLKQEYNGGFMPQQQQQEGV